MAIINGTPNNDNLTGDDLDTTIVQAGDIITGAGGDDNLYGLRGDDQLVGSSGHDNLYGGLGDDTLKGGTGSDNLFGDEGDDRLVGSDNVFANASFVEPEVDTLTGGAGADTFALASNISNSPNENFYQDDGYAVITDYSRAEGDVFEITGSVDDFRWTTVPVTGIGTEAVDTVLFHGDSAIAIFQDIEASQIVVYYIADETTI